MTSRLFTIGLLTGSLAIAACSSPSVTQAVPNSSINSVSIAQGKTGYHVVHDFAGSDGKFPTADLITIKIDDVDNLVGTTQLGGANKAGTIFSVNTTGFFQSSYSFGSSTSDGSQPASALTRVGHAIYGTTIYGGGTGTIGSPIAGTVYRYALTIGPETIVHAFQGNYLSWRPQPGSLTDVDGILYGTTATGGRYNHGSVFSFDTGNDQYNLIYSFKLPAGGPGDLISVNGLLYGMAGGGKSGNGMIYSITPSGALNVIHSFTQRVGSNAKLTFWNGQLFGVTATGGKHNDGTVFSVSLDGKFATLYDFGSSSQDAANPAAHLTAFNGKLYGTAPNGGRYGLGAAFSVTASGSENVLHSFDGQGGARPVAGLTEVAGVLYGTTSQGGRHDLGTVFALTP